MHRHRRRMGPPSDCCSYTRIIETTFHRIGATKNLRVLTKSGAEFFGSAHRQVVARTQSYQYNFFEYRPTSKVFVLTKIMHPTPAARPFRLLTYTRIIETTFHRIGATQESACTQNHGAEFIRIGPTAKLLLVPQSYQYNCFLSIITPRCPRTHKIMHPIYRRMAAFRLLLLHKNNRQLFSVSGPPRSACTHKIMSRILFDRPTASCCSYSPKLSIQLF
jgi:hypothetical protein